MYDGNTSIPPAKAAADDFPGRFREIVSDPLNLLIERVPHAGIVQDNEVYLLNGNRVPLSGDEAYYGDFSQILVINRGVHEPLEEFVFQELLKQVPQSPRMIELGAYWAHYSMWLQKVRPNAENILVEPDPKCLNVGRNNFARNGYTGEFIQAAVSSDSWQIDRFMHSRGVSHIDILHADIQRAELEMLEGARDALRNARIDYVFVSTHSQELHHKVVANIEKFGYRIEVASDFEYETTSYDGLVFASSPQARQLFTDFIVPGRATLAGSRPGEILQALQLFSGRHR